MFHVHPGTDNAPVTVVKRNCTDVVTSGFSTGDPMNNEYEYLPEGRDDRLIVVLGEKRVVGDGLIQLKSRGERRY